MVMLQLCAVLARILWFMMVLSPDQRPSIRMPGHLYREDNGCTRRGCSGRLKWSSQGQLKCNKCFATFVLAE